MDKTFPLTTAALLSAALQGDIQGGVLVFRDISARREAERQLKESNEHLKEFVAAAAHDLRSPLNSVNTMAQLVALRLQDHIGAEGREPLGYIIQSTQRMLRLLEDLLAYAQASHFELDKRNRASMDRALKSALENLRVEIESSGAIVTAGALPEVVAHEAHMVQLFQNLVGNALKYRSEAAPRVRIGCTKRGGEWVVEVSDNGIGIEPQYEQQIFKPFKRLHGEDRPGSGIGLATCQKIVSGYGGRIWLESQPGKGSTFFSAFPLRPARKRKTSRTPEQTFWGASLPDVHASFGRRNFDPVHSIGQLERLIDLGVRIKRHEKSLNQKIQRSAAHRDSADLDARQVDRGAPVPRLNAGHHLERFLALNQLRHHPVGLNAGGVAQFQEVHQRVSRGRSVAQLEPSLAQALWRDFGRFRAAPCIQLRNREHNHRTRPGAAVLNQIDLAIDALDLRIGRRRNRSRANQRSHHSRC